MTTSLFLYQNNNINSFDSKRNILLQLMKQEHFGNSIYEGTKGRVLLQLSKTYKGDERFKLNQKFKEDLDLEKLPEKFKQIAQKQVIDEAFSKTKKIVKKPQPSLIIQRFQPGTDNAKKMVKKAQGRQHYIESIKKGKLKELKKVQIKKGIDKVKKAELILSQRGQKQEKQTQFKIQIKGNRQQAFQKSDFKLFQ